MILSYNDVSMVKFENYNNLQGSQTSEGVRYGRIFNP